MSSAKQLTTFVFAFLLTALLVISLIPSVQGYSWSETIVVSNESTEQSHQSSIAVGPDNTVHIVWTDWTDYDGSGGDFDIFYKSFNGSWSNTVVVSTESTGHSFLPSIAVGPDNTVHVAWADFTDLDGSGSSPNIFYKSFNGSWSDTVVASSESTGESRSPSIAVGSDNTVHVVWFDNTDYDGSGDDYDIFYKTFNGTWSDTVVVTNESTNNSFNPSIVIDTDNTVHVVWQDQTEIYFSGDDDNIFYKTFNGTWSDTVLVSSGSTKASQTPSIAVGPDNTVHVAWQESTDGEYENWNVFYNTFNGTWSDTIVVSSESTLFSGFPSIVVDTHNTVHVVWHDETDYDGLGTDLDIVYKSFNGTWSDTIVVSSESTLDSREPSIALDSDNTIHIVWSDRTNFDCSGSDQDVFYKIYASTPPKAIAGEDLSVDEGTTITFDGSASTAYGGVANYTWIFAYGGATVMMYGETPSFTFNIPGTYTVTLTVRNDVGFQDSDSLTVTLEEAASDSEEDVCISFLAILAVGLFALPMAMVRMRK